MGRPTQLTRMDASFGLWIAVLLGVESVSATSVLVTGATGRTGSLLYQQLKADGRITFVRALVRNATKAKEVLGCDKCDASEGIYVGDVTKPDSLLDASRGVDTLAIAAGVGGGASVPTMKAVEFVGVENQVSALALVNNATLPMLRVVLCSSMGTTDPDPKPFEGGAVLFWKLNAEAFLGTSGLASTIIKPCGLGEGPGGQHALKTVHDDQHGVLDPFMVARADVAAVMKEAIIERSSGLRFGLCNARGPKRTDLSELLKSARWPWQQS